MVFKEAYVQVYYARCADTINTFSKQKAFHVVISLLRLRILFILALKVTIPTR